MLGIDGSMDSSIKRGEVISARASRAYVNRIRAANASAPTQASLPKVTLTLKGCERCGGDVSTGRDWHGDYLQCLQCGWYRDSPGDALSHLVDSAMTTLREQMEQAKAS